MQNIFNLIAISLLFVASTIKAEDFKYGIYQSSSCHWMGCTTLELTKETLAEKYTSDNLMENSNTVENYTVENRVIQTIKNKTKYYYFTHPVSNTNKCGSYLAPEDLYKICDFKKECMLQKSFCFVTSDYTSLKKIQMDAYKAKLAQIAGKVKASIIMNTCQQSTVNAIKKHSPKANIWVLENGFAQDIQLAKSTGSDETDKEIVRGLMLCKYNPAKEKDGTKVASWLQL